MKKIVIIGDIVQSKKISERSKIQSKLNSIFNKINSDKNYLVSPYTITLGDEFQAVYSNADFIFSHTWQISKAVYPEKIRFSIGIGEITTRINKKQAIGMDGPAFYNARAGLETLKESSYFFNITAENLASGEMLQQVLFLISFISGSWKKTRFDVLTMLYENKSIAEIAKKLKITDKAVYKNIDAGALRIILDLTDKISDRINQSLKIK